MKVQTAGIAAPAPPRAAETPLLSSNTANRLLKGSDLKDPDLLPLLAGTLSEGVARELILFCKIHESLTKIPDIVANPMGARVPDEISVVWAMTGAIAYNANKDNLAALVQYVKRLAVEFQVVCLRATIKRDPKLLKEKPIQDWIATSAHSLY